MTSLHVAERAMTIETKILGYCPQIQTLRETIESLAPTCLRILIRGETGTGKELVAQSVHEEGQQAGAGFVAVNCAELTAGLAPSVLFGHLKGSYTDARSDRRGVFQLADGGTLFFDEIGDLSPDVQGMLLRVIETGTFTPLGGERPIRVTFRFVSATHRDLSAMAAAGSFRHDLLHRIVEAEIFVPPLRERGEDVILLARHFLREAARAEHLEPATLPEECAEPLRRHPWPGNVRELKNHMRLLAVRQAGRAIGAQGLFAKPTSPAESASEEARILQALREAGSMSAAARLLGMHRTTLWRKLALLGIHSRWGRLMPPS